MTAFRLQALTPDTVEALLSLEPDAPWTRSVRTRLESGALTPQQLHVLFQNDTPVMSLVLGRGRTVVPRSHFPPDAPFTPLHAASTFLASHLPALVLGKLLILDSSVSALPGAPFRAAGWVQQSHARLYTTDLGQLSVSPDPAMRELPAADLSQEPFQAFLASLAAADGRIGDTEHTDPAVFAREMQADDLRVFALMDGSEVRALGALRVGRPGTVGVHLIGVQPEQRGRCLGRRLHAQLLRVGRESAHQHVGGTDIGNVAMQRIFVANGGVLLCEQVQLSPPERPRPGFPSSE